MLDAEEQGREKPVTKLNVCPELFEVFFVLIQSELKSYR
jgi:hypothetical protein